MKEVENGESPRLEKRPWVGLLGHMSPPLLAQTSSQLKIERFDLTSCLLSLWVGVMVILKI